jgi:hypothetical protein
LPSQTGAKSDRFFEAIVDVQTTGTDILYDPPRPAPATSLG